MLLKDVLSRFQELYGQYDEQDNKDAILSDNIKNTYGHDNTHDNSNIVECNYTYDNVHDDIHNIDKNYTYDNHTDMEDDNFKNYTYDNHTDMEDDNFKNYTYDNNITEKTDNTNSYEHNVVHDDQDNNNGVYNYDNISDDTSNNTNNYEHNIVHDNINDTVKPRINYDNDFSMESDIEGVNIDIDNRDNFASELASHYRGELDNNKSIDDTNKLTVDNTYNKTRLDNTVANTNVNADYIPKKQDYMMNLNNEPISYNNRYMQDIKDEYQVNNGDNIKDNKIDIDQARQNFHKYDNADSGATDIGLLKQEYNGYLNNTSNDNFWQDIGENVKDAWAQQFQNQKHFTKEEFLDGLSNALENTITDANSFMAQKVGEAMTIKNQFVSSAMNLASNLASHYMNIGKDMVNDIIDAATREAYLLVSNLYLSLKGINTPKKDVEAVWTKFSGIDGVSGNTYLSSKFKSRELVKNNDAINTSIIDRYDNNSHGINEFVDLNHVNEHPDLLDTNHQRLYELQRNNRTLLNTYRSKNQKGFSSMFKGYSSIQESLSAGIATDYYWDITLGYYSEDWKSYGLPEFPFNGGWFPVKAFTLDEESLDTYSASAGNNMKVNILTERVFPKTIQLTVVDDFYRQIERFGMNYNRAVSRISNNEASVLPYDKQAFLINILFMMPNYQAWRKVSYIAIPNFKFTFKGTNDKQLSGETQLNFNIVGIADYNIDTDSESSFNYFWKDNVQNNNNETSDTVKKIQNIDPNTSNLTQSNSDYYVNSAIRQ